VPQPAHALRQPQRLLSTLRFAHDCLLCPFQQGHTWSLAVVWEIVTDATGPGTVAVQYTIHLNADGSAQDERRRQGSWSQSGPSVTIDIDEATLSLTGAIRSQRNIGANGWSGERIR
jgi:hypothetical protein